MNIRSLHCARLLAAGLALWASWLRAEEPESADRTLSPYFFIQGGDPAVDRLPLKSTEVEATAAGVIADVVVRQTYRNEGSRDLEAQYVFPGSTRAAVYGLTLHVGERVIEAEIKEKKQARTDYQKAKAEGRSAALLEQHRPNVFRMNVAHILPGDEIRVELRYTELLVPTDGVYQFVYPTVVGPRYSNQKEADAPAAEHWIANPYLHAGQAPADTFSLRLAVNAGMALQDVSSPSHGVDVRFEGANRAVVTLASGTGSNSPSTRPAGEGTQRSPGVTSPANNRDFVLNYRLAGERIESGLLLYEGDEENFFLAMVEPPARVRPEQIPPREYVFVLDVSGSMNGFPLNTAKTLLRDLIGGLKPDDRFNVLLFSGASELLSPVSLPADPASVQQALDFIDGPPGGGGTELLPALQRALALPEEAGRARTFVVVTDGYVSIETAAFDLVRRNLGRANLFAFGIGSSVNRFLIEGLAKAGLGEPFIVTDPGHAPAEAERFRRLIEAPVLTHIGVAYEDFGAYDVQPVALPDLFAERPVILFGKWRGEKAGTLTLTGQTGTGVFRKTFDLRQAESRPDNAALRYLWARSRLADLADYEKVQADDERAAEITRLGLAYHLLTSHTSFLAVDTLARADGSLSTTVKQPLPLPAGVSNLAMGGVVAAGPEPEPWLLFGAAAAVFGWAKRRQNRHG